METRMPNQMETRFPNHLLNAKGHKYICMVVKIERKEGIMLFTVPLVLSPYRSLSFSSPLPLSHSLSSSLYNPPLYKKWT
jgi:hypothetical protein